MMSFCMVLGMTACTQKQSDPTYTQQTIQLIDPQSHIPIGDTAETSLDWNGTYKGVIPCADCQGIEYVLELNQDKTFKLTQTYLGKSAQILVQQGGFHFDKMQPSLIKLDAHGSNQVFFIGEGWAELRYSDGKKITGNLENLYRLSKLD